MRIFIVLFGTLWVVISVRAAGPADTARFNALMRKGVPFFQTNVDSAGFYFQQARALAIANRDRREFAAAGSELGNY